MLIKTLYPDGKNHAIPSLHRDSFVAYRDSFVAVPVSGNTTSPYCRAVSKNAAAEIGHAPYLDKFLMTTILSGTLTTNPDAQPAPGQFCLN
jgi:hypothetical protein